MLTPRVEILKVILPSFFNFHSRATAEWALPTEQLWRTSALTQNPNNGPFMFAQVGEKLPIKGFLCFESEPIRAYCNQRDLTGAKLVQECCDIHISPNSMPSEVCPDSES